MRLALIVACLMLWATPASAWTRTTVESTRAHLDVDRRGDALVLLEVDLRVRGGWISDFELVGMGEGIQLDADKPPWLVGEDGRKYIPQARVHDDGRVVIRFDHRRKAPWRGRYTLGLLYHAPLARPAAPGKASWALPAWRVDLQNVRVRVEGPAGLRLLDDGSDSVTVARTSRGGRERIEITRAQLPRTLRWELALGLPEIPETTPADDQAAARERAPFSGAHLLVGLLLGLCAWLKRGFTRTEAVRSGARALALIPLGAPWVAALVIPASGIAAGWLHDRHPQAALLLLLATAALGLTRRIVHRDSPVTRRRPMAAIDLQRARTHRLHGWLGAPAWLDATAPLGLTVLTASGVLCWLATRQPSASAIAVEGWLAALPLFFNATRGTRARAGQGSLIRLHALSGRLAPRAARRGAARLRLTIEAAPTGARTGSAPRLELALPAPPVGLRSLDLVEQDDGWRRAGSGRMHWRARVERGSAADARIAHALPGARIQEREQDRLHEVAVQDPEQELEAILDWLCVGTRPTDAVRDAA
ncbi:MAG: hypothetical protein OXT09_36945 [Myxococcales bacterium]|nr:hypothetical protein [Myxococcales bacterium]